jgi:hypothetical protein
MFGFEYFLKKTKNWCPHPESNWDLPLRRRLLCPLSYGGLKQILTQILKKLFIPESRNPLFCRLFQVKKSIALLFFLAILPPFSSKTSNPESRSGLLIGGFRA